MQINGNNQAALLARMYGNGAAAPVRPAAAPNQSAVVAKVGPAAPADKAEVKGRAPAVAALVAGVVPGKVDFSGETPQPGGQGLGAGGTYQMYRRPTDKMEAATVVSLGRSLDIQG